MRRVGVRIVLPIAMLVMACTDGADDPVLSPTAEYLADNFGLYLSGFDVAEDEFDEGGYQVTLTSGFVWVEGGVAREMEIRQELFDAAEGGDIVLNVTDVASGVSRYFLYNFDEGFIVFGEDVGEVESRGAGVQANPDGTYEVWAFDDRLGERTDVETVPDGYAAMRRVDAFNGFSRIDPHIVLTGFALGHLPTPEARCPTGSVFVANPPPFEAPSVVVCSIFKEFCDCVACQVLDRGGDCALCPQL